MYIYIYVCIYLFTTVSDVQTAKESFLVPIYVKSHPRFIATLFHGGMGDDKKATGTLLQYQHLGRFGWPVSTDLQGFNRNTLDPFIQKNMLFQLDIKGF